jgi:hypothetical protein
MSDETLRSNSRDWDTIAFRALELAQLIGKSTSARCRRTRVSRLQRGRPLK